MQTHPRISRSVLELYQREKGGIGRYVASVAPSLIGLALLIGLSLGYPSQTLPLLNEIFTLVFIIICALGAVAGQYPSQIRRVFRSTPKRNEGGPGYIGHHPSCGQFDAHVIRFRGKALCAGCTGLTIGAAAAVAMSLYTLVYPIQAPALIILIVGVALAAVGILQHALGREPRLHFALNVALVTGVAVARIGANQLNGGIIVDVYALALSLYLILARIDLSRDDHETICSSCDELCDRSYAANRKLSISDG
jgi:hypothetical protein